MYIKDGIVYAGDPTPILKVVGVRALADYKLWVKFNTDEEKVFDFKPELGYPCFAPLKDIKVFNSVYVDYGCPVWNDGSIDIAPEYLYENGVCVGGDNNA